MENRESVHEPKRGLKSVIAVCGGGRNCETRVYYVLIVKNT